MPADTTAVDSWPAIAGTAPTQATAGKRPDYAPNGWPGGGPAIEFSGGQALEAPTLDLSGTDKLSFIMAGRPDLVAPGIWFEYGNPYYTSKGVIVFSDAAGMVVGVGGPATYRISDGPQNGNAVIIAGRYDRTTSTDTIELWTVTPTSGGPRQVLSFSGSGDSDSAALAGAGQCWFGSRNNGASIQFDGLLRGSMVWKQWLDTEDWNAVLRCASWQWGLS